MHWTGIKPSWARKDFVKYFFISLVYPRQNHNRSSQVYGLSGKLSMFDKWKDSKGLCGSNTDSPRPGWLGLCALLRDSWKIRPLTVLLRGAIFTTTANRRLPFTLVSLILKKLWHRCNDAGKTNHPWNEAKPKWRRVSSGRPGCRTSYNFPSPTSSRRCSAICTPTIFCSRWKSIFDGYQLQSLSADRAVCSWTDAPFFSNNMILFPFHGIVLYMLQLTWNVS